ncbi:MAG: hypothetical protein ACLQJR_08475 [Stellaceae bacterium]
MAIIGSRRAREGRADPVAQPQRVPPQHLRDRRRPGRLLGVKIVVIVLMLNLLVAAMMLMKLRVPHLG